MTKKKDKTTEAQKGYVIAQGLHSFYAGYGIQAICVVSPRS